MKDGCPSLMAILFDQQQQQGKIILIEIFLFVISANITGSNYKTATVELKVLYNFISLKKYSIVKYPAFKSDKIKTLFSTSTMVLAALIRDNLSHFNIVYFMINVVHNNKRGFMVNISALNSVGFKDEER